MGRCYLLKLYNMSRVLFYVFALLFVTSAVRSIELSDENLNFLLRLLVKRDNSLDWNNGKCEDQYPACDAALCANENYNVRYKKYIAAKLVIWKLLMLVIKRETSRSNFQNCNMESFNAGDKKEAYSNFFFF